MLNKKGMTSVELLICFVVISTIVIGIYNIILEYRNKEQIEEITNEIISYSNNIQRIIQTDLIKKNNYEIATIDEKSITLNFYTQENESKPKKLTIDTTNNAIIYDEIKYKIPNIKNLNLSNDSKIEKNNEYLKITIILTHPNIPNGKYSFLIISPINF